MFNIELVKGKDEPAQKPNEPTNVFGKTVGLLLRLCRPLYGTGTVVILDSGFCVLKGIIELKKVGVYASALIKKRKYWPRFVDGDAIDAHMEGKAVGECDALHGTLDNEPYVLFAMKEPDYVMKIMSTYGRLTVVDGQEESIRTNDSGRVTFKYTEPFSNHFKYRHAVDGHNNIRQGEIALEGTWGTHHWPLRIFAFILAVVEVNVFLAFRYFVWRQDQQMDFIPFRKMLARALIENEFYTRTDISERLRARRSENAHRLERAPPHSKFFSHGKWVMTAAKKYQQYQCRRPNCKEMTRNYCSCSVGEWMCSACHPIHVLEVATVE